MVCMICDDQKNELEMIEQIVSDYAKERPELSFVVQCFINPFDMLDEIDRCGPPDIALLDICMPGVLGTESPGKFRAKTKIPPILFF